MKKNILIFITFVLYLNYTGTAFGFARAAQPIMLYNAEHDMKCQQWVDNVMNHLSLRERIGQLFIYTIAPVESKKNMAVLRKAVNSYKIGGLLFSGGRLEQQMKITNFAQQSADVPLMITFDGEWGLAMRLHGTPLFPRNMVLGCIRDNTLIYEYGREMARECREAGIQVNFSPVTDVNINPKNPVINTRSFGEDPVLVADKVIAYASGLESRHVLSVCKHFPGHGDTNVDSHKALPLLPFSRERLDSVELYPFKQAIRAGLSGIMVGHLQVPIIEPLGGLPSSLSRNVVYGLLTDELSFKGLIFTDALSMRGVSNNSDVCLQALKAGNDMVLAPQDLDGEINSVVSAIEKGELSRAAIDEKCRKVLTYKYALGLNRRPDVRIAGIYNRINTPETRDLIRRLNLAAITVLNNKNDILPLHADKVKESIALLEVGNPQDTEVMAERLGTYTTVRRFRLKVGMGKEEQRVLFDSLRQYKRLVVAIFEQRLLQYRPFFASLATLQQQLPTVYTFFTPGKIMMQIYSAISAAESVVLAHTTNSDVERQVADVLYGNATADGRLSASLKGLFKAGAGVTISPATPVHYRPEEYGMATATLKRIDAIAKEGIRMGAYPGCQIAILRDGKTMYNQVFGTFAGAGTAFVQSNSIYDLASLSKTTGTLLAIMKLYDNGKFGLDDKIATFLPWLRNSNKKNITIRELLFHQSGLPSGISFYADAIDPDSYSGSLFNNKKDATHTILLGPGVWANGSFRFKPGMTSNNRTTDCTLQVCDNLWLTRSFMGNIRNRIIKAPLGSKQYCYSDVGFILLRFLAERLSGMSLDTYLEQEFYAPMGLSRTCYLPLRIFSKNEVVPSAKDRFLRKCELRGFVNDEAAAFQGGISGNAGLFSDATEVSQIYQMLLNGGNLYGHRYLSMETCRLFTTTVSSVSRRGLGFDKPDKQVQKNSPCAASAPASVYGHTGFTGTCAWVDPQNRLVYVFLSNRTYPNTFNKRLQELDIRRRIQQVMYDAIKK